MNTKLNVKHTITFIITVTLALLLVACGATEGADMAPEPAAPVAPPEAPQSGGRPGLPGQGQGPGFEGGPTDGGPMGFINIISEATGLDPETLREETASGATLAEVITAHGGDVEAVKAKLIEAMSQMPNAGEGDIEQRVSDLLNNPLPMPPGIEGGPGGFRGDE
jgi:hypothetical protein